MLATASLVINYAKYCLKCYNSYHPLWDASISAFAYAAIHFTSKTQYENLQNGKLISILESTLLPGVSVSNVKRQDFQSSRLNDDCKENVEALWVDCRQQYTSILLQPMPFGDYKLWHESEVSSFSISKLYEESDSRYLIQCSLLYNDEIHNSSEDLPLAYCRLPNSSAKITTRDW